MRFPPAVIHSIWVFLLGPEIHHDAGVGNDFTPRDFCNLVVGHEFDGIRPLGFLPTLREAAQFLGHCLHPYLSCDGVLDQPLVICDSFFCYRVYDPVTYVL